MAEILEAVLELRVDSFVAALQNAAQNVTAFAQAISGSMGTSAQAFQQQVQQINQIATATQRAAVTTKQTKKDEDDFLRELDNAMFAFRKRLAAERVANEKQAAKDNEAQERATGQFIMTMIKDRVETERRAAAQILAIWQASGRDLELLEQKQYEQRHARAAARDARSNASAGSGLNPFGQGPGGALATQDIFLLQGYINLTTKAMQETTFFDAALIRVGSSLKTLGGYLGASFIIGIPIALAQWAKESVNVAIQMQSLEATFRAITGSAAKANQELTFLRITANRVGVDFLETANQFRNLEAAARGTSLEGTKVRAIFESVVTATRVMGLSSDQASRALLALEQMISKGTITAEELRKQLSQAIPGSVGIMARALGLGTEELQKMMKAGDLLTEDVLPRFGAQLTRELGPGLEAATEQAAATFARFGNNIRDISVAIGERILALLKPAMDGINYIAEKSREARREAQAAREALVGEAPKDLGSITGVGGKVLQGQIDRMREEIEARQEILSKLKLTSNVSGLGQLVSPEQIAQEENTIKGLMRVYKLLEDRRTAYLASLEDSGGMEQEIPFKRQTKEINDELKNLESTTARIAVQQKNFPALFTGKGELEQARQTMRDLEKAIDAVSKAMASAKATESGIIPATMQQDAAKLNAEYAAARKVVEGIEAKDKAEKEYAQESKRLADTALANLRQDAAEKQRIEEEYQLAIAEATQGETEKKLAALALMLNKARAVGVEETLIVQREAVEREKIYAEEARKSTEARKTGFDAVKKQTEEHQRLIDMITDAEVKATKTRVDNYDEETQRKRELFRAGVAAGNADIAEENQFEAARARGRTRVLDEENEKLAKEVQKSWRELGNTIESILGNAFESILSGSKNFFESIRDAFLKLLARLAADALTHAIIIPAIVQFIGGGGGGGGTGLGGASSSLFGGAGLNQVGSLGGEGGGGTLSTALGFVSAGNSISGALGGPTLGMGSFGGLGSGLMGMELGELGISGAGYIGGSTGSLGGLAATSVGTVIGGIGAGVATGMILSQINSMLGIHGIANTTLAGAGGGALAGTIILPGIGTAIGAVVGAIGGALAGILGKEGKKPGFDIESMQAGRVRYDDVIGLTVEQPFKILEDFHQKLGTDYEDFIAMIDESINDLFQQTIDAVSGVDPDIQKALVDPLNAAFANIASWIEEYPALGGDKFKEQMEIFLGTDLPKMFQGAAEGSISKFIEAVKKIDPVVKAFIQIIDSLLENIKELQQQQQALDDVLKGNIKTLAESLMSPAEILRARQQEYAGLLSQFEGGDEATRILLAPQIGQLANTIMELSKTVFNPQQSFGDLTGIQGAIKNLQESLYTPAQVMAARQTDMANLLQQFRSGDLGVRTVLTPQITQLALQIMELAKGVNTLAEQEALMQDFPAQLRAISEALYTPAQSFLSQQSQFNALMAAFRAGTPEEQLSLEPQIANLAAQMLQLAKGVDVLGQDPQLLRQTQADLLAAVQEVQNTITHQVQSASQDAIHISATLERTQAEMIGVLREVEYTMAGNIVAQGQQTIQAMWATAGQIIATDYAMTNGVITATYTTTNGVITAQYNSAGQLIGTEHYIGGVLAGSINNTTNTVGVWSNYLATLQSQLIGQVAYSRDLAWHAYVNLQQALWVEIDLARYEIDLLINSLHDLNSVDAAVARALGVLGEMNARLGNPLNVRMDQGIGTQLQQDTLQTTQNLLRSQQNANRAIIALLSKSAFGLSFEQGLNLGAGYTGYQHGGYVPFSMMAHLHRGERVIPEWENRGQGGGRMINITVNGGNRDAGQIANEVVQIIESKSGRLQSTSIVTKRR